MVFAVFGDHSKRRRRRRRRRRIETDAAHIPTLAVASSTPTLAPASPFSSRIPPPGRTTFFPDPPHPPAAGRFSDLEHTGFLSGKVFVLVPFPPPLRYGVLVIFVAMSVSLSVPVVSVIDLFICPFVDYLVLCRDVSYSCLAV
jgi:hypothetical protein